MPNPKYNLGSYAQKYPLIGDALDRVEGEMESILFWMGGENACVNAPRTIVEMIDKNIDASDAEKQALIIGAFYAIAPGRLDVDYPDIIREYGDAAINVVDAMYAYELRKETSPAVCRISTVHCIYLMNMIADSCPEKPDALSALKIDHIKNDMSNAERICIPYIDAPRLERLFNDTKHNLFAILENPDLRKPVPPPKKSRPPAP